MNNSVLTDMLQVYFQCNKNSYEAVRIYNARFPNKETPDARKFSRLEINLRKYGAFKNGKHPNLMISWNWTFYCVFKKIQERPQEKKNVTSCS
jgi:hypothetical protein